jgi:hypothetical protein
LHGLSHWKIEVIDIRTSYKSYSSGDKRSIATAVSLHIEDLFPQPKMGFDAQKCLAKGDEHSNVED